MAHAPSEEPTNAVHAAVDFGAGKGGRVGDGPVAPAAGLAERVHETPLDFTEGLGTKPSRGHGGVGFDERLDGCAGWQVGGAVNQSFVGPLKFMVEVPLGQFTDGEPSTFVIRTFGSMGPPLVKDAQVFVPRGFTSAAESNLSTIDSGVRVDHTFGVGFCFVLGFIVFGHGVNLRVNAFVNA